MRPLEVTDPELEAIEQRLDAASSGALRALDALPEDERQAVRARVLEHSE